jgi:hypothetical protein
MGLLAVPSRKPDGLERPSTMRAVSRLWLAQGCWLRAQHGAGSTLRLSLYSPSPPFPLVIMLCQRWVHRSRRLWDASRRCPSPLARRSAPSVPTPRRSARVAGSVPVGDDAWRAALPLVGASVPGAERFAPSPLLALDSRISPGHTAHTFLVLREIHYLQSSLPCIRHTDFSTTGSERPREWPSSPRCPADAAPILRRAPLYR